MHKTLDRRTGRPYPLGVTIEGGTINFSAVMKDGEDCGLILYDKKSRKEHRIPFTKEDRHGSVFCMAVSGIDTDKTLYNFYDGKEVFTDPYVKSLQGRRRWGNPEPFQAGRLEQAPYDWGGDKPLKIPYEQSILYCLNVRAFTRHKSSGVVYKGTFAGIAEKIPYLKELGITAIELMPVYEFDELENIEEITPFVAEYQDQEAAGRRTAGCRAAETAGESIPAKKIAAEKIEIEKIAAEKMAGGSITGEPEDGEARRKIVEAPEAETALRKASGYPVLQIRREERYNCWGYKESFYFSPKQAFSASEDVQKELKDLVRQLHAHGIEVILQFYFPPRVAHGLILDVLRYWVLEYHIDGIHLKGENLPLLAVAEDPLLTETKLFYYDFPWDQIHQIKYGEHGPEASGYRHLAVYKDDYMYGIRRFLKGDEGMLSEFLEHQRRNPAHGGRINYITNYYGFSLMDMVSYDRKHNEANGEKNTDGMDYNASWNCGVEGPSRKKAVQELRLRQMKNALTMLFLSQGTPLIYSGDEFANTRYGNNNPYCQDNETGWVKWNMTGMGKEVFSYLKSLIRLKKGHPILRSSREMRNWDHISCGYPDLSYHGQEAWRPDLQIHSRFAGVMYCGSYTKEQEREDDFFYIAYNMHWMPYTFALPKLPKGMKWHLLADTGSSTEIREEEPAACEEGQQFAAMEERRIQIYISKKIEEDTGLCAAEES